MGYVNTLYDVKCIENNQNYLVPNILNRCRYYLVEASIEMHCLVKAFWGESYFAAYMECNEGYQ